MLRSIPEEVLRIIVSYCDVSSNVRLAATATSNRRFVYRECTCAWEKIDFDNVPNADRLSDADLHTLLTNVNALKVTSSLSLMGCTAIRGQGLAALMYSRRLEQIELRRTREEMETCGPTGLDNAFVIRVLSSMPPINGAAPNGGGLKLVKIRRQNDLLNFYDSFSLTISDFFSRLNDAIANQMKEQRVACECCECVLAEEISEDDFRWIARTCYCSRCKNYGCGIWDECVHVDDCRICMDQVCSECDYVERCDVCERSYCGSCRQVEYCRVCKRMICEDCSSILQCSVCYRAYCTECRPVKSCNGCTDAFCSECDTLMECQNCSATSCSDCNTIKSAWGTRCAGACSNCNIVCSCVGCKRNRTKQQPITKYFVSTNKSATKRRRLS